MEIPLERETEQTQLGKMQIVERERERERDGFGCGFERERGV
jgi:hypothetical protein